MLLERNSQVGKKLRIAGKGRCNLTNDEEIPGLERKIPGNPKFLRTAFYHFTPKQTVDFFHTHGVETKVERGGRVFPVSDDADDVADALLRWCRQTGVILVTEAQVTRLLVDEHQIYGVETAAGKSFQAPAVIIATGGATYPGTGSTGDGYRLAEKVGHTIVPIRPSLVPLETVENWPAEVQGLSLRNVELTALAPTGEMLYRERGEMLFTHFGVSGPLVLSASRHLAPLTGGRIVIDLKPALDLPTLDARVQRDFTEFSRRVFSNALGELLPRTLIPVVMLLSHIHPDTPVHQITRVQRQGLVALLKGLMLTVKKARALSEAIVTVGGVSTREIDPRTMASKVVQGLYFTGEVIDVDGYTGGYNLQIAWSTGHLAGETV